MFTLSMIAVFEVGTYIPLPGVTADILNQFFSGSAGSLFSFFDVFSGGALKRFSIFALTVTPYINAAIIIQLLTSVLEPLKKLSQEGEEGRKKMEKYVRWLTLALALVQSTAFSTFAMQTIKTSLIPNLAVFVADVATMTAGSMFLLWIGEKITEFGIGNGVSIIIFAGIVSRYPSYIGQLGLAGNLISAVFIAGTFIAMVVLIVYVQKAEYRIPVMYSAQVRGRRMYGNQSVHIPIKVNQSGVLPIIFASAIVVIPGIMGTMLHVQWLIDLFGSSSPFYLIIYTTLVIFFTYFYSTVIFDPEQITNNIQSYGGHIPGYRPGIETKRKLTSSLSKLAFIEAFYLAVVAILPYLVNLITNVKNIWVGGTSLLIAVGVALDIMQQMEAHMLVRHYDGFTKKAKV